jgi:hypothetical protein
MPREVAKKPAPEIERRARAIVKALYEATDGLPMQWRKLTRVTGSTEEALQYAVDRNWLTVAGHSACLTVEGRQLITKGFN